MGRGSVELMSAYAVPLPMRVIAAMLGVPDSDYPAFKDWSVAVISYSAPAVRQQAAPLSLGYKSLPRVLG